METEIDSQMVFISWQYLMENILSLFIVFVKNHGFIVSHSHWMQFLSKKNANDITKCSKIARWYYAMATYVLASLRYIPFYSLKVIHQVLLMFALYL